MPSAFIFYTLLFFVLLALPAVMIVFALLFFEHERRLWKHVAPMLGPFGQRLARSPAVARLGTRFPRAAGFLSHRFNSGDPWGLPATLAGIAIGAGLWVFLGIVQDLVAKDPLVILDIRLHNAAALFRTPAMTRLMLVITELGGPVVVPLLCTGAALLALARNRSRLAATFMLALAGPGLISVSFKALFGNERPIDAIVKAHEASFPSGHMLSGAVVYGLLAALLLSSGAGRSARAIGVTLLTLLIVSIGLSRLYLGVHWPSDLLGSLGLALIALAALLFFLHYARPIRWIDTVELPVGSYALLTAGKAALVMALIAALWLSNHQKIIVIAPLQAVQPLGIDMLRTALPKDLPRWSEDLIGGQMEPVSLVLIGSENDLLKAFTRAGWAKADLPTPLRVFQEGLAALRDVSDPTGPATPAFMMDRPQSFTFEKPDTGAPSIRRRHHIRIWQTQHCLMSAMPGCRPIWLATASFDVGMELSMRLYLPTHRIDPLLDKERAFVVAQLEEAGARQEGSVTISAPMQGMNAAGDPFWTDGQAVILLMSQSHAQ